MSEFMQRPLDHAQATAPAWLARWLEQGRRRWRASPLPTRKTEHWKYTALQALRGPFAPAEAGVWELSDAGIELPDLGACRVVFVNGYYRPELSSRELPVGVSLVRFGEADERQAQRILEHLGAAAGREAMLFTALNDATLADGLFLEIAPGARVEQPLQVVWVAGNQGENFSINQRLLVLCGRGSKAGLIEQFAGTSTGQKAFTNGVTELLLEPETALDHYRLHLEEESALHIGGVYARLAQQAVLNAFHLATGSELKRLDVVVEHRGEGAACELNGVYLPRGSEHVDYHTTVEHCVPRCTTEETFRGIIGDEASAVFNGRIHIHPGAQKTRAQLSNRNLLTSPGAEVNAKPELEIYADDVQCAHGTTVAQLDEMSLHYLRTRGVSRAEAEVMLSFGFVNEVIDTVRWDPLRAHLRILLARRFARDTVLARQAA